MLDAVQNHLLMRHVQRGGRYGRSKEVNAVIQRETSILNPMAARYRALGWSHWIDLLVEKGELQHEI